MVWGEGCTEGFDGINGISFKLTEDGGKTESDGLALRIEDQLRRF